MNPESCHPHRASQRRIPEIRRCFGRARSTSSPATARSPRRRLLLLRRRCSRPIPGRSRSLPAGAVALPGGGSVCAFDFGEPAAPFNALRGYNAAHVYDTPGSFVATVTRAGQKPATTHVTVTANARRRSR